MDKQIKAYVVLSKDNIKWMLKQFPKRARGYTCLISTTNVDVDQYGCWQIGSFDLTYNFGKPQDIKTTEAI